MFHKGGVAQAEGHSVVDWEWVRHEGRGLQRRARMLVDMTDTWSRASEEWETLRVIESVFLI